MRASKGFWIWISVAIAALLIGLFIANYSDLKSGYESVKNDVQTQIEQVLPNEDETTNTEGDVVEGENNEEIPTE